MASPAPHRRLRAAFRMPCVRRFPCQACHSWLLDNKGGSSMTVISCPLCSSVVPATTCYRTSGVLLDCPGCRLVTVAPRAYRLVRHLPFEVRVKLAAEARDRYENEGCPHLVLNATGGVTLREGSGVWDYRPGNLPRALLVEMGLFLDA